MHEETILTNIRVLAIDQQFQETKDGGRTVIGSTATLELTPEQSGSFVRYDGGTIEW